MIHVQLSQLYPASSGLCLLAWPEVACVQGTGAWGGICAVSGQMRSAAEPELILLWAVVADWGQQKICCL